MIFAIRQPVILAGLVLGFLAGVVLRHLFQTTALSGRARRLRPVGRMARRRPSWSTYLDPYGTVAAVLSGVGWGARTESGLRRTGADVRLLLAAVAAHAALAAAGFAAFVAAGGDLDVFAVLDLSSILHGSVHVPDTAQALTVGFGAVNFGCAVLALVPLPPLEMGAVLWGRIPRTPGARRVAYHLLEEQWGVAVVLLLLLLPLAGQQPVLLVLIDAIGGGVLPHF